ncbi:hypothetical protein DUI87_29089 [Hirundo rustica rustica]|uniref:Uncharacterized protein n=1 Tax=Hirundo rustica rustica TaxID=333673 RepID=A0A3M0J0N9_HIRRU|nr:hypothetical protein DUI87_29089 [Hirundo rustica rustica]
MLEGKNSTYKEESQEPATREEPCGQCQEIENEEEDKKIVVDKDPEKQFEKKTILSKKNKGPKKEMKDFGFSH